MSPKKAVDQNSISSQDSNSDESKATSTKRQATQEAPIEAVLRSLRERGIDAVNTTEQHLGKTSIHFVPGSRKGK